MQGGFETAMKTNLFYYTKKYTLTVSWLETPRHLNFLFKCFNGSVHSLDQGRPEFEPCLLKKDEVTSDKVIHNSAKTAVPCFYFLGLNHV